MSWLEILVAIGAVGFIIYQQVAGQAVAGRRLIAAPAVLTVVGFVDLSRSRTAGRSWPAGRVAMVVTARRDTDPMTIRLYWLIRFTGFAVIGILALLNPPDHAPYQQLDRAIQIACFSVVGLALVGWLLLDEFPRHRRRGLPIVLGVIAAASGLTAVTAGGGQSLVAFAAVAAVAAGADLDPPSDIVAAAAVAAAGIAPIWIVGPLVGCSFGTLAGYPLLIAACVSLGRNRRSYRVQAQQSAALLEQYERLRAEQRRADVLDERTRIAREIHDVLAHSLGALGIQIQAAKAMLTDHQDIGRAVDALSTAQRMAADGLTETRRAVHALRVTPCRWQPNWTAW